MGRILQLAVCLRAQSDRESFVKALQTLSDDASETDYLPVAYEKEETLLWDVEDGRQFDLIFLEAYQSRRHPDAMEAARSLRSIAPSARFALLTKKSACAVEGYDAGAFGCLLLPADPAKLSALLQRTACLADRPQIRLMSERRPIYLYLDEILYAESHLHSVTIYLQDGSEVSCARKLSELQEALADPRFLRCHQSYLVNLSYVASFDEKEGFILRTGESVPVKTRGRRDILRTYDRFYQKSGGRRLR